MNERPTNPSPLLALVLLIAVFILLAWWSLRHNHLRAGPTAADTHIASAHSCETRAWLDFSLPVRVRHNPLAGAPSIAVFRFPAMKVGLDLDLELDLPASGSISIHQHAKSATEPWAMLSRSVAQSVSTRIPPMVVSGGCSA